jgi:ribosomal protein L37AE/L43A
MIYRDPKCVFVADSPAQAQLIVVWLADHNIAAEAMNQSTLGGLEGLTWLSRTGVSASGIEVWVLDPAQADQARDLIAQHSAQLATKAAERSAAGDIEATCEDCGGVNVVPGSEAGKVWTCRHCGEYMDVPDPSEAPELSEGESEAAEDD